MRPTKTALDCLSMSLTGLGLSVRTMNVLEFEGITTMLDLVTRSDENLLEVRSFGETTFREVKHKLNAIGLRLGMRFRDGILTFGDEP